MGVDLKVLASQFRERRGEFFATASMRLDRDSELFEQLTPHAKPCLVQRMPGGMRVGHYEDEGLKWEESDRHGLPLTFTTPANLQILRIPDDIQPWNRAVLAFLLALPVDSRIVLYWC